MQAYHSPLHIIPKARRDQLDELNPKMLRRELLLRLELSGSTTLEIDGRHYDRNEIIRAVDELQQHLPEHVQLFRNKPLLDFVENAELGFFKVPGAWTDLEDPHFQSWLQPYFTARYSQVLYRSVSERSYHSINKLRTILEGGFSLPADYRDDCHHKTFSFLREMLAEVWQRHPAPFEQQRKKQVIDPGVETYVNLHYYNVFQLLGDDFHSVVYGFGRYCHEILAQAFPVKTQLRTIARPTLVVLHNAARIAMLTNDDPSIAGIYRSLGSYLSARETQSQSGERSIGQWVRIVLFIGYLLFLLFSGISTCDRPRRSNSNINFPEISRIMQEIGASMTKEEFLGRWQTPYMILETDTVYHQYVFFGNHTGQSIYYFPANTVLDSCGIHFNFIWETEEENLGSIHYQTLSLSQLLPSVRPDCDTRPWPALMQGLYERLEEPLDSNHQNISFFYQKSLHPEQRPKLSIFGEQVWYERITSPQTPSPAGSHPDSSLNDNVHTPQ